MLWFKKSWQSLADVSQRDQIDPAKLIVHFDAGICRSKQQALFSAAEDKGGIDEFINALSNKQKLFNSVLAEDVINDLTIAGIEALLDTVFTARRKLPTLLNAIPSDRLFEQVRQLLYGQGEIRSRMQAFVDLFSIENRKIKRSAWDFAAEMLHFNSPELYPHMGKWVWSHEDLSGALREFLPGSDSVSEIPLGGSPGDFEAARLWLAEQLGQQGFYRDIFDLTTSPAGLKYPA